MMRIALVSRGCRPGVGGELYVYELARRLAGRHVVTVLSAPERTLPIPGVRHLPVPTPPGPQWVGWLGFNRNAGRLARAGGYDLVHAQGSECSWSDVMTAHSCHLGGMRASLRLVPGTANRLRKCLSPSHRMIMALETGAVSRAGRVLAVSRRVSRELRAAYPALRRAEIRTIYPGVDAGRFSRDAIRSRRARIRNALNLPADAVIFLLAANAPRLKGSERLLRGLAQVRDPRIHLLIASAAGEGGADPALADRLRVRSRLRFLAAAGDVRDAMSAADVYAALPEYEGFGLSVLEAMACSLPVMVARNAGVAELLAEGREGVLLPVRVRTEGVARALDRLAGDAGLRLRLGGGGRKTAEQYSWDRMTAEIEAVYEQAATERRLRPSGPRG